MTEETQEELRNVKDCDSMKAKANVKMIESLHADRSNPDLN